MSMSSTRSRRALAAATFSLSLLSSLGCARRPAVETGPTLPLRRVDVAMYWHERTHHSAPHRWLRERIREVLAPGGSAG